MAEPARKILKKLVALKKQEAAEAATEAEAQEVTHVL